MKLPALATLLTLIVPAVSGKRCLHSDGEIRMLSFPAEIQVAFVGLTGLARAGYFAAIAANSKTAGDAVGDVLNEISYSSVALQIYNHTINEGEPVDGVVDQREVYSSMSVWEAQTNLFLAALRNDTSIFAKIGESEDMAGNLTLYRDVASVFINGFQRIVPSVKELLVNMDDDLSENFDKTIKPFKAASRQYLMHQWRD